MIAYHLMMVGIETIKIISYLYVMFYDKTIGIQETEAR